MLTWRRNHGSSSGDTDKNGKNLQKEHKSFRSKSLSPLDLGQIAQVESNKNNFLQRRHSAYSKDIDNKESGQTQSNEIKNVDKAEVLKDSSTTMKVY